MRELNNVEMASVDGGDFITGLCNGLALGTAGGAAIAKFVGAGAAAGGWWGIGVGLVIAGGCFAYNYAG